MERRWGANSWAIRVVALSAALRVERRAGEEEEVVPTEKEGVTMMFDVVSGKSYTFVKDTPRDFYDGLFSFW